MTDRHPRRPLVLVGLLTVVLSLLAAPARQVQAPVVANPSMAIAALPAAVRTGGDEAGGPTAIRPWLPTRSVVPTHSAVPSNAALYDHPSAHDARRPASTPAPSAAPTSTPTPTPTPTSTPDAAAAPAPPTTAASALPTTAAERYGWGAPDRKDDFSSDLSQWRLYDGPGHAGQGVRSPSAASVANSVLTLVGDPSGTTEGMTWLPGRRYGRWEARVKVPAGDPSYNALLLLWPDADNFPIGGEIDFMELTDPMRRSVNLFVHHGVDNSQVHGEQQIDATQWHNWAVEWTPDTLSAYVDGIRWWSTTDTSILPPGPMHLAVQLDWFPTGGVVQPSEMMVDWVRQYPL